MITDTLAFSRVLCGYSAFSCHSVRNNADGFRKGNGGTAVDTMQMSPAEPTNVAPRFIFTCRALCCPRGPSSQPRSTDLLLTSDLFTQCLNDGIVFGPSQTDNLSFGLLENGRRVYWSPVTHRTDRHTQTHPSKGGRTSGNFVRVRMCDWTEASAAPSLSSSSSRYVMSVARHHFVITVQPCC